MIYKPQKRKGLHFDIFKPWKEEEKEEEEKIKRRNRKTQRKRKQEKNLPGAQL